MDYLEKNHLEKKMNALKMESGKIKTHNMEFEKALNRIKEFSQKEASEIRFEEVKTRTLKVFNHKVTGEELNSRLSVMQKHIGDLNESIKQNHKEFGEVYRALNSLDKDYIRGIELSIERIETTFQYDYLLIQEVLKELRESISDCKEFNAKVDKKFKELKPDLTNMKNTLARLESEIASRQGTTTSSMPTSEINTIKKNIAELQTLKAQLAQAVHLKDIDKMWSEVLNINNTLKHLESEISSIQRTATSMLTSEINTVKKSINELQTFKVQLSRTKHLNDVDKMWTSSENHAAELKILKQHSEEVKNTLQKEKKETNTALRKIETAFVAAEKKANELSKELMQLNAELEKVNANIMQQQSDIAVIFAFVDELSGYAHLSDIDELWSSNEEHRLWLNELVQADEELRSEIVTNTKAIDELQKHKAHILEISHLDDVDAMWATVEEHTQILDELKQQDEHILTLARTNQDNIHELQTYESQLRSMEHLHDVDDMWRTAEEHQFRLDELAQNTKAHADQLVFLENKGDEARNTLQKQADETNAVIADLIKEKEQLVQTFTQKLKYAYWIAGGALGVAVIDLIGFILGVM